MSMEIYNNNITITGEIMGNFEFSHDVYGENFYTADVSVKRTSNTTDIVPIMVSDRMVDVNEKWDGICVEISGQIRSYNRHDEERNHLILSLFVREFRQVESECMHNNSVFFDGYICKTPVYRQTPLGREISDILVAVNRTYGKSDYIPCICWGRNARYSSELSTGTRIKASGRFQSRDYSKKISENEYETRRAYEVSIGTMEVVENEKTED